MVKKGLSVKQPELGKVLETLREKGSIEILYHLYEPRTLRFSAIERLVESMSSRTLSKRLRHLEEVGLISRRAYAEIPPRVEYSLTEKGIKVAESLDRVMITLRRLYTNTHE